MPKLNFPASPLTGTLYTENGNTWKWNGTSWISYNSLDLTSQVSGALGMTYGGTGYSSNNKGDILVGTGSSWYKLSYSASANDVLTVDTTQPSGLKWAAVPPAAATSVQVSSTNQNSTHYLTFVDALNGSGLALSTDSTLFYNPSSNLFNIGGLGVSGNASVGQTLLIYDSASLNYIGFKAGSLTGSTTYTLPVSTPAIGTSVLQSNSGGILSWVPMVATGGGGAGTVDQGQQYSVAFYPQTGTAVTGNSNFKYNTALLDTLTLGGMTFVGSGNSAIQITNVPNGGQILTTWSALNSGLSLDSLNASLRIVGDTNAGTTLVDLGIYSNSGFPVGTWTSKYLFPKTSEAIFVNGLKISNLTNSTNTTSGALNVEGGIGISGNAFIGGTITAPLFTGNISATAITSTNFYGTFVGYASTSRNLNIVSTTQSADHYLLFTPQSGTVSGAAVSSVSTVTLNPSTNTLSLSTGSLTANGVRVGNSSNTIDTSSGNLTLDSNGGTVNLNDNLIVQGNLTVNGTTTTIDSTVTTFLDPVIVLGSGAGNTHSTVDDNKDRGVEFRYANSGNAITGFFGYKDDTKFYYIPDANIASDGVYTGIAGTIVANLEGFATTSQNIVLSPASTNSSHRIVFTPNNSSAGSALSTNSTLVYNPSTDILSVSGLSITSPLPSTSTTTGALVVAGGVGIGDSLFTNTSSTSSISGVVMQNSIISSGVWAGTTITYDRGGTGYSSYNKGDLLVGTNIGHLQTLPVGLDNQLLTASSASGLGISWKSYSNAIYGAFASTTNQTIIAAGGGITVISYDTVFSSNGINIYPIGSGLARTTRIYFSETGVFNVQFSAQLNLATTNQTYQGDIWFRKNGLDIPTSNTRMNVPGRDLESVMTVNIIETFLTGDYLELAMYGPISDFGIGAFASTTTPENIPAIPSIITTVTPVSYLLPGGGTAISGIAQINNQTGASQLLVVGTTGSDFNISSASNVHTFNLPDAGPTVRGVLNTSTQTIAGSKTFTNNLIVSSSTNSESTTTGALTINGGLGLTGNAFIGGTVTSIGNIYAPIFQGNLSGTALTSENIKIQTASTNSNHRLVFTPNDATSGVALSTNTTLVYNPSTDILSVSGAAITSNTSSTSTSSGALIVSGGLGVAGNAFIGGTFNITDVTNSTSTSSGALVVSGGVGIGGTLSVLSAIYLNSGVNGLSFQKLVAGSFGAIYSTGVTPDSNNYSFATNGTNLNLNSTNTLYLNISNTAKLIVTTNNINVGINVSSNSISSGAFTVTGGIGIGGNAFIGGTVTAPTFNGNLSAIAATSTNFYGTLVGSASTANNTNLILDNSASGNHPITFTPASSTVAGAAQSFSSAVYITPSTGNITATSFSGNLSGYATTGNNISIVSASTNASHLLLFTPSQSSSGSAISSNSTLVYNPSTDILNVSGLAVTSSTASTSSSTGSIIVSGGLGIAGNAFIGGTLNVSQPINIQNGGTNASSFGQSAGFIYYDGSTDRLVASTGLTIDNNGYLRYPSQIRASSFFANNVQLPNGTGGAGRVALWTGTNTLTSDTTILYDTTNDILSVLGNINSIGFTASAIAATSSTSSTSTGTGALVVSGGFGLGGNAFIGGTVNLTNATQATYGSTTSGALVVNGGVGIGGSVYIGGQLGVGGTLDYNAANNVAYFVSSVNSYSQVISHNHSSGSNASADFVVSNDQANDATYYGNFGMNSSGWAATTAAFNTPNAVYLAASGGDLAIGSITENPIRFFYKNGLTDSVVMAALGMTVLYGTDSDSTLTGALTVRGGLGITGNAYIGGTVNITNTSNSTSTNSGALVVSGGLGVSGDVYVSSNAGSKLAVMQSSGDEGGEIFLNKPVTNTTITTGVTVDIYQNKLRFFEAGGSNRGFYLDITSGGNAVGTNIMGGSSSGTVNTGTANFAAYYASSTNAVSENANLQFTGTGISIGGNINATSTTSGSLFVRGGVGIGDTLLVGGMIRIGSNTFTKSYSQGDIALDNGSSTDTAGISYYWGNNSNFGSDVLSDGVGSTRYRIVYNMNETGGREVWTVDQTGQMRLYNSGGSAYIGFRYSGSAITTYTLPANSPQSSAGTSVLSSTVDGVMSWVPLAAGGGSGSVGSGTASRLAYYQTSGTAVTDTYGINYNLSGTASTLTIFGGASSGSTVFSVHATSATSVRVGIGVSNPAYALEVDGEISATSKSFVIDHPTKSGMKLRYGSLEGPENGVYIRGVLKNSNIIETPDYWEGLVDSDSFTVNLTPIGNYQQLFVEKIENYKVYVGTAGTNIHCYYHVYAERKDVEKLKVEY